MNRLTKPSAQMLPGKRAHGTVVPAFSEHAESSREDLPFTPPAVQARTDGPRP